MQKGEVIVYSDSQATSGGYQILGKVFLQRRGTGFDPIREADMTKKLKVAAQEIGGEALIGLHFSNYCGEEPRSVRKWGSALVARRLVGGTSNRNNAITVAIVRPRIASTDIDSTTLAEENEIVLGTAQYYVEKAGYYSTLNRTNFVVDTVAIHNKQFASLDTIGGPKAMFVLLLECNLQGSSSGESLSGFAKVQLKSYLYSKESRSMVWENAKTDMHADWPGLLSLLTDAREKALYKGLEELFETFNPPTVAEVSD